MLSISPRRLVKFLSFVILGLLGASFISQSLTAFYGCEPGAACLVAKIFDVNREKNLPTLYAALTLLLCSGLTALIALKKGTEGDRYRHYWTGLAGIFLFLGLDEGLSIHEKIGRPVKSVVETTGIFHYAWLLPALLGVTVVMILYIPFFRHLPQKIQRLIWLALAAYLGGALGMEMVAGFYLSSTQQMNPMIWAVMTLTEEGLEMLGVLFLIRALLSYMAEYTREVRICVGDRPSLALESSAPLHE